MRNVVGKLDCKRRCLLEFFRSLSCRLYIHGLRLTESYGNIIVILLGTFLFVVGGEQIVMAAPPGTGGTPANFQAIERATCVMLGFLEGPYGALLTASAGLGAVGSAVFGSYKGAYNFLIVGIGCFTARSVCSMYFGMPNCSDPNIAGDLVDAVNSYTGR